jgi:hypothetical protein
MQSSNALSFTAKASTAFVAHRRMKLLAAGTIDYAGVNDRAIGTLQTDINADEPSKSRGAVVKFCEGIHFGTYGSATALAVGDELQAAANGKITKRTTGVCIGLALETASADGDVIRYLPIEPGETALAGEGGAVTQETSASTGVTLDKSVGQITTVALSTAAGAEETFTVTNAKVTAADIVVVSTTYDGAGTPAVTTRAVADGSFKIVITNLHASSALNAALVVNFRVLQGATA